MPRRRYVGCVNTRNAHDPLLPPASQDAIVSRHVLWTLRDPALPLRNWRTSLRPGGLLVVVGGLGWQGRDPDEGGPTEPETRGRWERAYGPGVRERLPAMLAQSMDPILDAVETAGLVEMQLSRLEHVERVERVAEPERARWNERYVISARRPA